MQAADVLKFSNSFLFLDGDQAVVQSSGDEGNRREKRAHTKSRNGCVACKRRRVKVYNCVSPWSLNGGIV